MSRLLHQAEATLKRAVNAGPQGRIVACGTGATGAIDKLQQILGVALPPVTRKTVGDELRAFLGTDKFEAFREYQQSKQPVVFVGPYEHHSNEVTWRAGSRDGRRGQSRGRRRHRSRASRVAVAGAGISRPLAHRVVLGGLQCHRHALAGPRDRQAAARQRCLRLFRLRGERALCRHRHESAAGRRRRRRVARCRVPVAAQVSRRPGVERRAGLQRAPVLEGTRRRASRAAAPWIT